MQIIEQTLNSREVAEMVEKSHNDLLKDIRRYIEQFNEGNISHIEFFREDEYKDGRNRIKPCYKVSKKGCEFIAHKLTGQKGTEFTARYINRFHEMEDTLTETPMNLPIKQGESTELINQTLLEMKEIMKEQQKVIKQLQKTSGQKGLAGQYKEEIIRMLEGIGSIEKLRIIYTITKRAYEQ